jgi:hypothetical protein
MLSANVPEKPGTSISKADNESLFIHRYNVEGWSAKSALLQDKTQIFPLHCKTSNTTSHENMSRSLIAKRYT